MSERDFRVIVTGPNLAPAAIKEISGFCAKLEFMEEPITENDLLKIICGRRTDAIILRGNPPLTGRVIESAHGLKVISKHGAGIDTIDVGTATKRGVVVVLTGGTNAAAVAEMTIALMFTLGRDIVRLDTRLKQGYWERGAYVGRELRGRMLGIIGFGQIGRRVAEAARALGLEVVAWSRRKSVIDTNVATPVENLEDLLRLSDIVSLHCPATAETRGLISRARINSMKPGALVINTARGSLIDEFALAEALIEGRIGGAALDTLTEEPPPKNHPILSAPNVIVTPHVAAFTSAALDQVALLAVENMIAVLSGRPVDPANVVNPEAFGESAVL
jgi:D-3-phosphoglycerate dehydrogenase / 2-oxoglutarate reductase